MLNDPFVIDQAAKWSTQLLARTQIPEARVQMMYKQAFSRAPTQAELQATLSYVAALQIEHAAAEDDGTRQQLVWQDVAHALFCVKEFIYVE